MIGLVPGIVLKKADLRNLRRARKTRFEELPRLGVGQALPGNVELGSASPARPKDSSDKGDPQVTITGQSRRHLVDHHWEFIQIFRLLSWVYEVC